MSTRARLAPLIEPMRCSFCGKEQGDVLKLVAGAIANICDECIEVSVQVICDAVPDFLPRVLGAIEDWRFHV